jgi:hypothetical protein
VVKRRNGYRTGGRRPARSAGLRPQVELWLGWLGTIVSSLLRRLQMLQSKCLRLVAGAPFHLSNRQIHEDLGVPFFADHVRALTESFDSKLADAGNPTATGQILTRA